MRNPVFPGECYEWNLITISYGKDDFWLSKKCERTRTNKFDSVNVYGTAKTKNSSNIDKYIPFIFDISKKKFITLAYDRRKCSFVIVRLC